VAREASIQTSRSQARSLQTEIKSDNYVIRQGDQIQLNVWGYPEFNTTGSVKENGNIAIALLGDLNATGLTKEQFTDIVRTRLSEYIQGEIKLTLSVVTSVAQKVTVLGYVTRQENIPISSEMSLLEVLSAAGGTTPESDIRRIKIIRFGESQNPIEVDLTWYIENGNLDAAPMVRPGDTVFIPKSENVIRELSDFLRDVFLLFGFFRIFN
jgi:polysaccharide export outer membrane protein